jgi:glutaredoxin 3
MAARVTVYTTDYCPYCVQAKRLLREMAIDYDEIDVGADPTLRMTMVEKAGGRRTVPQIFIDGESIGGYTELRALADTGGLAHLA